MGSKYLRIIAATSEPLEFWRDTSEQYIPPPGYYAPLIGFGLVWASNSVVTPPALPGEAACYRFVTGGDETEMEAPYPGHARMLHFSQTLLIL